MNKNTLNLTAVILGSTIAITTRGKHQIITLITELLSGSIF